MPQPEPQQQQQKQQTKQEHHHHHQHYHQTCLNESQAKLATIIKLIKGIIKLMNFHENNSNTHKHTHTPANVLFVIKF